ncbi:MAG: metal-dependent transcriptional regulator [archaeon]|nr:metal-dependent transcriptional regulator [archaeon]
MGSELKEDCLINMLRMSEGEHPVNILELATYMERSSDEIAGAVRELAVDGLVALDGHDASFTDSGLLSAREIRKKHHVMESFLVNVLGMDHLTAHLEAHQMEHKMSQESMQKLCHVTGNHHDKDCSACTNPCENMVTVGTLQTLYEMAVHLKGRIAFLRGKDPSDVKKLISMGFVPGRDIEIESRISSNGPRVVNLGESTVAVDAELSKAILVNVGA